MYDKSLRAKIIRLAHANPHLRADLLPLLGQSKKAEIMRMVMPIPKAGAGHFAVDISTGPNPDFRPGTPQADMINKSMFIEVKDLAEAQKVFHAHARNLPGGGNNYGGRVFDDKGKVVAYVSYNGRLWNVNSQQRPTTEMKLASATEKDEDTVTLTREGYKLLAKLLDGFEEPGPWGHVVSYAIAGKPMEAKHVKKVLADISRDLGNWATVSKQYDWTAKDKKNLTQAKGLLENNMSK